MSKTFSASILSIGDELLIGQVINTNAAWLSQQLTLSGFEILRHLVVADSQQEILHGLEATEQGSDLILITGGLGPTKDDITKHAIARYFDDTLSFHEHTYKRLRKIMERFGRKANDNQRLQCELPTKAGILPNELGTAPAMHLEQNGKHFFFMPGVPFEMKHLFSDRVIPILEQHKLVSNHVLTRTVLTAGIGEAVLEERIADIVDSFPDGLGMSYLPGKAQVRLRLTGRGINLNEINEQIQRIENRLGTGVFGYGEETLEQVVGRLLLERQWMVGFAESCTGGAVSARITSVPGASQYFKGSVVSYSNEIKAKALNVSESTLATYGAVSKECVREMVAGALDTLEADVAVAISGIAGPAGGSEDKPVGTVFIGVGDKEQIKVKRLAATKSRDINIEYFVSYALNLLRLFLIKK